MYSALIWMQVSKNKAQTLMASAELKARKLQSDREQYSLRPFHTNVSASYFDQYLVPVHSCFGGMAIYR